MNKSLPSYDVVVQKGAALLLLAYPVAMLTLHGGMNSIFLLMILLALAVMAARPAGIAPVAWRREWTVYAIAMGAMTVAIFASQVYHHAYRAHPHDAASRYWLAIPVLLLLVRLPPSVFKGLQVGFPVAAIVGLVIAREAGSLDGRMTAPTLDAIHYGDFELILGMLALFSINWFGRDKPWLIALKLAGLGAGLFASFASGSRGGWVALPVFAVLFIHFRLRWLPRKAILALVLALALAGTSLYFASPTLQQRLGAVANEISKFSRGERDSSTGARLQLYRVAVDIFASHPLFGVGPEGFAAEMQPLVESGKITPYAGEMGRAEVHSDILAKAAALGILGLTAMLAVYIVPFWLFWRAGRSHASETRIGAAMGLAFVSGFFIFGLTVEFLDLTMAVAFYSFTVAVLLAACHNEHRTEPTHP